MRKILLLDNKREFMTGCRMFFLCLVFLLTGMLLGCNTDDESGDDEDNTPVGVWTLTSVSYYEYNSDDQLIRETDYNNTGNTRDSSDMTWYYEYDSDGFRTGYYVYEGFVGLNPDPNVDADGVGTYFYNTNDCNNRLEEQTLQGTNPLQVWKFDVDDECRRLSYEYYEYDDGRDPVETGTYHRDDDGNVIELRLGNSDYWKYTLDINGDRLRFDFYENDTLVRYGIYFYAGSRLDELHNYEKR